MPICENCHYKLIHPNGSMDCLADSSPAVAVVRLREVLASDKCRDYMPRLKQDNDNGK